MTSIRAAVLLPVMMSMAVAACDDVGGSESDLGDRDARCIAACEPDEPSIEGAGPVCDTASHTSCLDQCEARIAGTTTTCATCLVEGACLGIAGDCEYLVYTECSVSLCRTWGPGGECSFAPGDESGFEACRRQVDPRYELACEAAFRPTVECESLCDG